MLELENLSLSYNKNNKVLRNVTLQVDDGECILLIGESGSGKSSIVNAINGLAFAYENAYIEGSIRVDGKEIKNMELYEISLIISSVFQNPKTHFFNVNTTLELLFYLENIGIGKEEMNKRMKNMLKIFPIEHLLERSIFELSGGEKQILCVASCYISGCKIIVLDEPSSNLDDKHIDILMKMLKILKDRGITLIIAEHRIYYLMDFVDRILFVQEGVIKRFFSKKELLALSSEEVAKFGLRSTSKTILKNNNSTYGNDLTIQKLIYSFQDKSILKIENISFKLGNIYGITGKNGCGKSTLLRILTGLEKKEKSTILFQGSYLDRKSRLKNSSLVMQDVNHQLFEVSVEKEMILGVRDLKQDKIDEILLNLGLTQLKDRHPMSLSGGEKQRVAIASVLCKNSKFIFFDEPTSGMDYNNMLKISKLIKKIKSGNNIIFIVSHDIEFLNVTADSIICLENYL